jgi:hypothetical protein
MSKPKALYFVEHPIGLELKAFDDKETAEKQLYGRCKEEGCRVVEYRLEGLTELELAARAWWRSRRPVRYSLSDHLKNPTVNTNSRAETELALMAARSYPGYRKYHRA